MTEATTQHDEVLEPNKQQQNLIENIDGIYFANAGPGTGKTFTISHRYAHILEHTDADPSDLLLITYTRSGADNMKERIIDHCSYDGSELRDAPINTFHGYCFRMLKEYGFDTPQLLGIDDAIGNATRIVEDKLLEKERFRRFWNWFHRNHPEHGPFYRIVNDPDNMLELVHSLAVKGIIPTKDGWYRESAEQVRGDSGAFSEVFAVPNEGGNSQSTLKKAAKNMYRYGCLPEDTPPQEELIDGPDNNIPPHWERELFEQDRDDLFAFVRDVFFAYLEYALARNYLNFPFVLLFAYVLLRENAGVRERVAFEYVMVDEFQDSNEIQFKLMLLLSATGNICAVGDWKQSIFSFQHTNVENIQEFEERMATYYRHLSADAALSYSAEDITTIDLTQNYRSTQDIIDNSKQALLTPAKRQNYRDTELNEGEVEDQYVDLTAARNEGQTAVERLRADDEKHMILAKIQEIVDNPEYTIPTDEGGRHITYGDIAILSRNRDFGLKLQGLAEQYNIPLVFEGGMELFSTNQSLLLLAWLRVLHHLHHGRGWGVILEYAGYTLPELDHILSEQAYPDEMLAFRNQLQGEDIGTIARLVFQRYGFQDAVTDAIINQLTATFTKSYMPLGEIVRFIERNIDGGETFDVDNSLEEDVAISQTIHKAKGLEYPVVFIADVNSRHFPGSGSDRKRIVFEEEIGIRCKKRYIENEHGGYLLDDWKTRLLTKCYSGKGYNEERRLLYVAMTRAENYLYVTAETGNESPFYNKIPLPETVLEDYELLEMPEREPDGEILDVPVPETRSTIKRAISSLLSHAEIETGEGGRGKDFGSKLHRFAEHYARTGEVLDLELGADADHVVALLDELKTDGELRVEQPCLLPIQTDDRKYLLTGVIDLIHITDDTVTVIDYKTDTHQRRQDEYAKQVSAYVRVLEEVYPDREVQAEIFYTYTGERVNVDLISEEELAAISANMEV